MRARRLVAVATAGVLALSGCGFKGLYSTPLPGGADLGDHPFEVTAYFDDALDLVPQSAVKVNDVAVGKVTAISLDGWSAKVTMDVNDSVKLPANATAEIAQTSLLGEKYVSLDPPTGTASAQRLRGGSRILLDHTRSAAEVEQVLGALSLLLNEGGISQLRIIGNELVSALKGREPQIKDLLKQLNTFVGTLDNQKTDITNALDSIDRLSATLDRQKKVLTDALDTYPAALRVLAQERAKFTKLLTSLDRLGTVATKVIDGTQSNLVTSLKALTPTLRQLRASGDFLPKSLRVLGTFPFPLGTTRQLVKGDYANLNLYLNLDLTETLCGLSKALCSGLNTSSASTSKAGDSAGHSGSSAQVRQMPGVLVESGR
ncbi:phospholipid/cholesterol/gamma-HCH transport system substrate-binding protein [Jatrophihabitans endophyticus]|uniref:Phospholipid/cholesterol/gamma-HCH transport system substrate-binding protein n=1 Tax=Jatrophihabitans endophyticus TaxID=1206085 RepID=A0A1M5GQ80_9ACTN|nr:MCE family protein [Jatrophihabitans endophyticus]SHG05843.1 phospholipid/cholesterol/gamma-HCH transport system substrate-binding protein [Jatrophihabitans endophyticus]